MDSSEEPIFPYSMPQNLIDGQDKQMSSKDLQWLTEAFSCCVVDMDWYGQVAFDLEPGELENIKMVSSGRVQKIHNILLKWNEKLQSKATPQLVVEILDNKELTQVKELWFSNYSDDGKSVERTEYRKKRKLLFEDVASDHSIGDEDWRKLLSNLGFLDYREDDASHNTEQTKRLNMLNQWTLCNGYNKASNDLLEREWKKISNLPSNGDHSSGEGTPVLNERSQPSSSGGETQQPYNTINFGLLHHSDDEQIANRIRYRLKEMNCSAVLKGELVTGAGTEKPEKALHLHDECECVIWIATPSSCSDQSYLNHDRSMLQHSSIKSGRSVNALFTLIPKEFLYRKLKIPEYLDYLEPLKEDDKFVEQVEATLKRIRLKSEKKRSKRKKT